MIGRIGVRKTRNLLGAASSLVEIWTRPAHRHTGQRLLKGRIDRSDRSSHPITCAERSRFSLHTRAASTEEGWISDPLPPAEVLSRLVDSLGVYSCRLTPASTAQPNLPSISKLEEVAAILDVSPEYLAYNVQPGAERIVYRSPERENIVWVSETTFGEGPDNRIEGEKFGFPDEYLRRDLRATPEACIVFQVNSGTVAPALEYGDRAIIDTSVTRPTPRGMFLYWDGVGAVLAHLQVPPRKEDPVVHISGKGIETSEVPVAAMRIIGRVKGRLQQV